MAALHPYATPIKGPDVHHLGGRNFRGVVALTDIGLQGMARSVDLPPRGAGVNEVRDATWLAAATCRLAASTRLGA